MRSITVLALALALLLSADPAARPALRVFIDAGHGTGTNEGNRGVDCQLEAVHTRAVADALATFLSARGFAVEKSRGTDRPSYQQRLAHAERWKADVVVSVHSDSRGEADIAQVTPDGGLCLHNDSAPGFAVLWSDEGMPTLKHARARLGDAVSASMLDAGFGAYSGDDYGALYRPAAATGGWIDIRPRAQRIYLLRKPTMPSVIIETHHALDVSEVAAWKQPETLERLGRALEIALHDFSTTR